MAGATLTQATLTHAANRVALSQGARGEIRLSQGARGEAGRAPGPPPSPSGRVRHRWWRVRVFRGEGGEG